MHQAIFAWGDVITQIYTKWKEENLCCITPLIICTMEMLEE